MFVVVVRTTLYKFFVKKCFSDTIYISIFVFFCVFVIVHNFFYPHSPIRIRHPQVSSPRFADTYFVIRFFELFTLPASHKLNTQKRSAPSVCVFKEEGRSVLISVTLIKAITGYKITVSTIGITFCM